MENKDKTQPILLIDFGSTYTKVTAVDLKREQILATAAAHTTAESDLALGLSRAMAGLELPRGTSFGARYACSSAAGGLGMAVSGLVPELTAEAAKQAGLGAGAKLLKVFSYEMTQEDLEELEHLQPDIFLLAGGTDGGNTACMLQNARLLAKLSDKRFPVILAGNRSCAGECARLLEGFEIHICPNVMPRFGELSLEPVRDVIRRVFLERIVKAKGLERIAATLSAGIVPTPAAVLSAVELLAQGAGEEAGMGELVAVDVGGATTDVYSVADGMPHGAATIYKGLPQQRVKRTVEGDIGMRYGLRGVLEAAGPERVAELAGLSPERCAPLLEHWLENPGESGEREADSGLDFALGALAIRLGVTRHAGTMEQVYTPMGLTFVQTGKDLTAVKTLVMTGGALIRSPRSAELLEFACCSPAAPGALCPDLEQGLVDERYILSAMGLLAKTHPEAALRILKKHLRKTTRAAACVSRTADRKETDHGN